jgi:hypothetical protein
VSIETLGEPLVSLYLLLLINLFSFFLAAKQVEIMINKYHIYLLREGGRINMYISFVKNNKQKIKFKQK